MWTCLGCVFCQKKFGLWGPFEAGHYLALPSPFPQVSALRYGFFLVCSKRRVAVAKLESDVFSDHMSVLRVVARHVGLLP